MKMYNFNSGPAVLPGEVLQQASEAVLNFNNTSLSIHEIGHRSDWFVEVLEEAKLVTVTKNTDKTRTQTFCRITALGRKRYIEYLAVLEQVLMDAASAVDSEANRKGSALGPVKS